MSGLEPGFQLGHYRITRSLGSGGMADVYEAHDEHLDRIVALKILPIEYCRNPQLVQRFQKEVRAAAKLNHRNIVTVFEVGQQDSYHFFSMRLLTGGDLRRRIEEGLAPVEALAILREVADAFAHAHARGFVHRDVKPENIMFDEQGFPVLTDFGIAKALDANTHMTRTGMTMGTPRYLSPEQASGKPVDARADLYSLGIILHEMLTGRPPYEAEEAMAVIFKHVTEPIPVLPPDFGRYQPLLEKLMAKDPNQRFSSAGELIQAIDALVPKTQTAELKQSQLRTTENPLIAKLLTPSPLRTPAPQTPRPVSPPTIPPALQTPLVRDMSGEISLKAPPVPTRPAATRQPGPPATAPRADSLAPPARAPQPPVAPAPAPSARRTGPLVIGGILATAALAGVAFLALRAPEPEPTTTAAAPAAAPTPSPAEVPVQAPARAPGPAIAQPDAASRSKTQQAEAVVPQELLRQQQEAAAQAKRKADEQAQAEALERQRAEDEAARKQAAELEAKQRDEIKARQRAELEAKQRTELEAKQRAELEARQRAELDTQRRAQAEEAQRRREAEAREAVEAEERRQAQEAAAAAATRTPVRFTLVNDCREAVEVAQVDDAGKARPTALKPRAEKAIDSYVSAKWRIFEKSRRRPLLKELTLTGTEQRVLVCNLPQTEDAEEEAAKERARRPTGF